MTSSIIPPAPPKPAPPKPAQVKYPRLRRYSNGCVVLFLNNKGHGVSMVTGGSVIKIGIYSETYCEYNAEPLDPALTVQLSNAD